MRSTCGRVRLGFLAILVLGSHSRLAAQTVLDFDALRDGEAIGGFYSGGFGSMGSGPGPGLGVSITPATVRLGSEAGGSGTFTVAPSPSGALLVSGIAVVNVVDGFTDGASFAYFNPLATTEVRIFDGPNLSGRILSNTYLPASPLLSDGEPMGSSSRFLLATLRFSGVARSVGIVSRGQGGVYLDDLTLGEPPVAVRPRYTLLDLGPAGNTLRLASSPHLNQLGQVFVQTESSRGRASRVVFWDPAIEGSVDLGSFGGLETVGSDINQAGQVVGWSSLPDRTACAFIWELKTGLRPLGSLGGRHSMAAGINDAGQVVGSGSPASGTDPWHAFVWQDGVMTDLNDLDIANRDAWLLERADSINNHGVIVGSGLVPVDGRFVRRYFALTPSRQ
jgi:probable HAF family extracellular repeat protein